MTNRDLAIKILEALNDKGAGLGNVSTVFIEKTLNDNLGKSVSQGDEGQRDQFCQCDDASTKHFIKNWCNDCQKHIV